MPLTLVSDPDPEPEDSDVIPLDVSSAPAPIDRLRAFLAGPLTDTERAEARRRADLMAGWGRRT